MYDAFFLTASVMVMIVILLMVILTWIGYDARSRGMSGKRWAMTTLACNDLGVVDYLRKRKDHPIMDKGTNTHDILMAERYRSAVLIVAAIVTVIAVTELWYIFY